MYYHHKNLVKIQKFAFGKPWLTTNKPHEFKIHSGFSFVILSVALEQK